MAKSLREKMKKFEKNVQEQKKKNIYLSAKVHEDNITGKEMGHIKLFTDYNDAKEDGDGQEPVLFGTSK